MRLIFQAFLILAFSAISYSHQEKKDLKAIPEFKKLNAQEISKIIGKGSMAIIHERANPYDPLFVTSAIVIDAKPYRIWSVILDWDNYEKFMPQTDDVKVVNKQGNKVTVEYHLRLKFSVISMKVKYTLTHIINSDKYYEQWFLVKGDVKDARGSFKLLPLDDDKTVVLYTTYADLKSIGFIIRKILSAEPSLELGIQTSSAVLVVKALKERVEKLLSSKKTGGNIKEGKKEKRDFGF